MIKERKLIISLRSQSFQSSRFSVRTGIGRKVISYLGAICIYNKEFVVNNRYICMRYHMDNLVLTYVNYLVACTLLDVNVTYRILLHHIS